MPPPPLRHVLRVVVAAAALLYVRSETPDPSTIPNCAPYQCPGGGPNISYPFWHHDPKSDSYCGYVGLDLACVNGTAAVTTATHTYFLDHVDYESRTVRVIDADALKGAPSSCPSINQNLTYEQVFPLYTTSADVNLTLFLDCLQPYSKNNLPPYYGPTCPSAGPWFVFPSDKVPAVHALALASACKQAVVVAALKNEVDGGDLTGRLPEVLRKGFELQWLASELKECKDCEESGGLCGYKNVSGPSVPGSSGLVFACNCPEGQTVYMCGGEGKSATRRSLIVIALTGSLGLLLMLGIFGLCLCFRRLKMKFMDQIALTDNLKLDAVLAPLALTQYKYLEVKRMTNAFAEKLGRGGFGTVYKGKLSNGVSVAVKVLTDSKGSGDDFINEVAAIGRTNHVNVVGLLGFCFERSKRALVYEYMPNGSLEKFLFHDDSEKATLGWDLLFKISLGIAKGLEYLHKGCKTRIVHFDIKPHNVLLDEDFIPKISDFGLAKFCPNKESDISIQFARGTIGYIAPEVFSRNFGTVSSKSDVYSYGMMILEMVGRRRNVDPQAENCSQVYFPHWVYDHLQQDKDLEVCAITTETQEIAKKMIIVGLCCIQTNPDSRPTISRVVEMLEGTLASLHMPPKPYICSPPRSKFGDSIVSTLVNTVSTYELNVC